MKTKLTYQEIITLKPSISRSTAWRARKRGYCIIGYHTRQIKTGNMDEFPVEQAYHAAWHCYYQYFCDSNADPQDLVQEAVLRMLELSGVSTDFSFQYRVARSAMRSFLKNHHKSLACITPHQKEVRLSLSDIPDNRELWDLLQKKLTKREKTLLENFLFCDKPLSGSVLDKVRKIIFNQNSEV